MKQCNGACGLVKPGKAFTKGEWTCKSCRNKERTKRARTEKYGITFEEFSALLDEQEGRCAICEDQFEREPMVDHDHVTRKVRGLLCKNCNTGLGMFRDNYHLLYRAGDYIGDG